MKTRLPRALAALLLVLALAPPAPGQGTSGTLPGPISTPELERYALRLDLGPQQRLAVQPLHDDYKRRFELLRQGEIAEFLGRVRAIQSAGRFPPREEVRDLFDRMDRIQARIRVLDDGLFDRIQPLLTETQLMAMPRVRKARLRTRLSSTQMGWRMGGPPLDLSDAVLDLDLDRETTASVDGLLMVYEDRMSTRMGRLHEASSTTMLRMVEALEERGFGDASLRDPAAMMKIGEAAAEIMQEIAGDTMALGTEVHQLNRTTARRLIDVLPDAPARTLRRTWLDRTYRQIGPLLRWPGEVYGPGLEDETLDAEKRAEVAAVLAAGDAEMEGIAERSIAKIDALLEDQVAMGLDMDFWQKYQEATAEVRETCSDFEARMVAGIDAVLGPGAAARLAERPAAAGNDEAVAVAPEDAGVSRTTTGADQSLPAPIGTGRVRQWAGRLGLDEGRRAIALTLHEAYLEAFDGVETGHLVPLREARDAFWQDDVDADLETLQAAADRLHRLRGAAMAAIGATDAAFFDEIATVLFDGAPPPALEAARLARQRESWALGPQAGVLPGGVDLVAVVEAQRLDPAAAERLAPRLLAWEREAAPLFEHRWRTALEVQRRNDRWTVESRWRRRERAADEEEPDPSERFAWVARYREILADSRQKLVEAERAIARGQEAALDDLASALDPAAADDLRDAFHRRAVPDVFTDATEVRGRIAAALDLPDLSPVRRDELVSLAADYGPEYRRLTDAMVAVALTAESPWFTDNDSAAWAEYQSRQDELARLRFRRSEANGRAIATLRRVLDAEQLRRIGGVPEMQ